MNKSIDRFADGRLREHVAVPTGGLQDTLVAQRPGVREGGWTGCLPRQAAAVRERGQPATQRNPAHRDQEQQVEGNPPFSEPCQLGVFRNDHKK